MSNNYELLLRHPELITENTIILGANADLPAGWLSLLKEAGAQVLTWDFLTQQAHQALDNVKFAMPQVVDLESAERIILLWPKAKQHALALIQLIANVHTECWVVGANNAGGKSIGKNVAKLANAEKVDAARHSNLWKLSLEPATQFNWLQLASSFNHQGKSYITLPGVFSQGKLDVGTSVLLEHLPAPSTGKLLDLGCGSGVIGLSMKAQQPALEVTLADVDAFALQSARLNSMRLNLPVEVIASDGLSQVEGKFDYIFTNPPFHQGKETDYRFAQQLFRQAKQHLVEEGQLWLVANSHLAYEEWAKEHFSQVEVMTQEKGFKLICVY